jgi:tetratricopeptide (TPR) repeat protein
MNLRPSPSPCRRPALRLPVALLSAILTWLPVGSTPAWAEDDAGTESVFAYGAGNRALAMGGAYVAAVDDASATLWNPAGLARLSRGELQAVQSLELEFGVTESYASVALPSWRWGAAGLVFRHFGVGEIDRRDSRNVVLADDLGDSEFELARGYGRPLGEGWSVGGAVKLQRQSRAGFSGSGLGLDLGINMRPASVLGLKSSWADGFRWALALRNAVEPAIRLNQESVGDPLSLRTGLAWQTITRSGAGLLAEVDLSKTAAAGPRVHAGVEYRPHPAAAVRLGVNDGLLTAGAGLEWRDLTFDYAFEDARLSPAHRAGLTFRFGATTEQKRLAHQRREDDQIAARLTEAFHQRQSDQVAGMLERATEAHARGDFDDALDVLALIAALEPGHPGARALERTTLKDKALALERSEEFATAAQTWDRASVLAPGDSTALAGAARCREESDRRARRTSELRVTFARAMDAFANDDLDQARLGFRAVLHAEPSDAEAARMLQRTELALARRATELSRLAAEASRAQRLAAARQDSARTSAPAKDARPSGPRLSNREIEDLYQRGLAALRARRNDDALRYWELVWSARPQYREVATFLKREYLARGMESFAAGRLDDAVTQWERVLRIDPGDARARGYLERAQKQRDKSREILGTTP